MELLRPTRCLAASDRHHSFSDVRARQAFRDSELRLHYCVDGSCNLRFSHGREEWLIPLSVVAHSLYQVQDPV